jgi:hypothetical protein
MAALGRVGESEGDERMARGGARGAGGAALILGIRGDALSTRERGGLARERRARQVLDSEPWREQCGGGDDAGWAGHCGHLGPVAMGPSLLFHFCFLFSVCPTFCLLILFQNIFVKYKA